jgi:hypothetical protein
MLTSFQASARQERPILTAEIKFLVASPLGVQIREWARARLSPDPHGVGPHRDEYHIASIYLDTPERHVFHRRGSYARSKYRLRRYGDAQTVFLERKLRTGTRLAKRRTIVDLDTLSYLEDSDAARGVEATSDAIAADPTLWFRRRIALRRLRPECQVQYARTARVGEATSGPLRLTLDEHVTTVPVNSFDFAAGTGAPILVGQMVLELKYSNRVPALFKELIEEFRLTPTAASKYRFAVEALGTVPLHA